MAPIIRMKYHVFAHCQTDQVVEYVIPLYINHISVIKCILAYRVPLNSPLRLIVMRYFCLDNRNDPSDDRIMFCSSLYV